MGHQSWSLGGTTIDIYIIVMYHDNAEGDSLLAGPFASERHPRIFSELKGICRNLYLP